MVAILIIFTACSFKSPHTSFINDMGTYMADYNDYEKEKKRLYSISDKYLVNTTFNHNGDTLYHFNWDHKDNRCPCRYYIVVNKEGTIIGWGFDPCDREKCCIIVG